MKLFENSFQYLSKRYVLLIACLFILFTSFIYLAFQLNFNNDISKTFSSQKEYQELNQILNRKNLTNKVLFSVKIDSTLDDEAKIILLDSLCDQLQQTSNSKLSHFSYRDTNGVDLYFDYFTQNLPYFFSEAIEQKLNQINNEDSLGFIFKQNLESLSGESSFFTRNFIVKDPLHLSSLVLINSTKNLPQNQVNPENGFFVDSEGNTLITSEYNFDLLNSNTSKEVKISIEKTIEKFESKYAMSIEYFSGFLITLSNSETVAEDSKLTLSIGISLILLLLIFYYRSLLIPLLFVIPGAFGAVFSLGIIYLIQGEISLISLGTGAAVMGIILDFSFHFFTHFKETKSLNETIRDISTPLVIGSLTTILAFSALIFTNSPILQDFGLFTSLALIGSILFILFFFPALLSKFNLKINRGRSWKIRIPAKLKSVLAFFFFVIALISIPFVSQVEFDDDIRNLNYQDEKLNELEKKLNLIEPLKTQRIFVLSKAKNPEVALHSYSLINDLLIRKKKDSLLDRFINVASFIPSKITQDANRKRWKNYMAKNGDSLISSIRRISDANGINNEAFQIFYSKINDKPAIFQQEPCIENQFRSLIDTSSETSYLSIVDVPREKLDQLKEEINQIPNTGIIDRSEISKNMVKSVQYDFNYILLVSSLIVFLTLLLLYGRIEMALVTFLPMVISWLIICGIAVLIGIKFNFVNIVVTTFIFGLGDDFAIFISDAYLKFNRTGKQIVSSYNTGIFLSALTTIIGTGVLIFAEHPAMKSIALISVIGLVVILIVSQTLQPILLELLITKRTKKGKPAWSLSTIIASAFSFSYFFIGCVLLFFIFLILLITPIPKLNKQRFYRKVFQLFCWSLVYIMFELKKKKMDYHLKDFSKPKIIIANHSSFLDILLMVAQSPKVVLMTNDWVYKSPFFGIQIQFAGYIQASKGVENNIDEVKQRIAEGCSVVIFPEGRRSTDGQIKRFHKGAFYLAKESNIPIQPILLHGIDYTMSKSDFMLKTGQMTVKYLPGISSDDNSWGETYQERAKSISKYFKSEHFKLREELETPQYFRRAISNAFIYTSPLTEWYVKIKYRLEQSIYSDIFTYVNQSGKVYDLGCGMGYVSMLLHLRYPSTTIIGVDYDQEKIEIAKNTYLTNSNDVITFESGDIRETKLKDCTTVILGDVLHYIQDTDKKIVLSEIVSKLEIGGRLIIRDGLKSGNKHEKTKKTELYSTKIIQFNKTDGDLEFIGTELIEWLIKEKGLSLVYEKSSDKNSNCLFVFEK
jgi:1-acyl-sn-glycerol-3-phosphate acyltransferase